MTQNEMVLNLLAKSGWTVTDKSDDNAKAVVVATTKN